MGDFLVGAVLAILGDGIHQELPAELRLLQVERRGLADRLS